MIQDDLSNYLPLTETTYYILLALTEPLHRYTVMKKVLEICEGTVNISAGTLYNVVFKLQRQRLIVKVQEDDRRKFYQLSQKGQLVLSRQIARLEMMLKHAQFS